MSDRYAMLQPNQLEASLASMPRRWKDAFRVAPDLNIEDFYQTAGTNGTTMAEHCGAAITQLKLLTSAIKRACYTTPEPLDDGVSAAVGNNGSGPWPDSTRDSLNQLGAVFAELSELVGNLSTSDWNRSGTTNGQSFTVIELTQGASRVAADRLSAVEQLVRELT